MSKINKTCIEKCKFVKLSCIFKKNNLALQAINNQEELHLGMIGGEFYKKKLLILPKTIINLLEFIIDDDFHEIPINYNLKKECKNVIKKLKSLPKDVLIDVEN